ncbi:unnamed protein product [Soboliphyme baturini]|uniref:Abhydrolase_3 domain-containing protein n=1 Tax=Soboliphyme baturini TaxID=241478 RepID=A0A183J605_9BILA|nr:unnamed protein product [Soboliphyme baturini]
MLNMLGKNADPTFPKSQKLVFHCHGGGFVATSSKTHETYLKYWAKELDCPIVSVDYSLAPENPFPRAFSEVVYAYAWCLTHQDFLGWTGESICFAGESAGGTLVASLCLKIIELNLPLLPDGLVMVYTPYLLKYAPSPSRLLSLIDPLLSSNVMANLVDAYVPSAEQSLRDEDCCDYTAVLKTTKLLTDTNKSKRLTLVDYFNNVCKQRWSSSNGRNVEFVLDDESDRVVNLVHFNNIVPDQMSPEASVTKGIADKTTSTFSNDPLAKTYSLMDDEERRSANSTEFMIVNVPENARTIAVTPGAYDEEFLDYLVANLHSLPHPFTSSREVVPVGISQASPEHAVTSARPHTFK